MARTSTAGNVVEPQRDLNKLGADEMVGYPLLFDGDSFCRECGNGAAGARGGIVQRREGGLDGGGDELEWGEGGAKVGGGG